MRMKNLHGLSRINLTKSRGFKQRIKKKTKESEETLANELLEKLVTAKENAASLQRDMLIYVKQEKLRDKLIEVQRHNYNKQFNKLGNATGTV